MLRILGTTTSPYTRKVRIVARAAGLPARLVDTRAPEGAELLGRCSPLEKVPVLLADGEDPLPDSGLIVEWLWARHEGALRAAGFDLDPRRFGERARAVLVEGATDAAVNRFYLRKDGFDDAGYLAKQRDRVARCLRAIEGQVRFARPLTSSVLSLGCFLDWGVFRGAIDLAPTPGLAEFREAWRASGVGEGTEPG